MYFFYYVTQYSHKSRVFILEEDMTFNFTPLEARQVRYEEIAREVLADSYLYFQIRDEFFIKEDFNSDKTKVECVVTTTNASQSQEKNISGTGTGPVDAFFNALMDELSGEYTSLDTFEFAQFATKANLKKSHFKNSGSSAEVEALVVVRNGFDNELIFRDKSQSLSRASARVVLKSVEFFVNIERAVRILKKSIDGAKKRNRGDILNSCILQLSELVNATSYEKMIGEK